MKDRICKAFCDTVAIHEVPAGLAVSTTVASINGDPVNFYIVGPLDDGRYRLEDSGLLVPFLHAAGADFDNQTRRDAFEELLAEHHAAFDEDRMEIVSDPMVRTDVPAGALRFVSLLMRVGDLVFMAQEKAASTFKDDAALRIRERLAGLAQIREGEPLSPILSDWEPDLVIEAEARDPVAVFLVQTEYRILEALLLHSEAINAGAAAKVVALLERESSISQKTRIRAHNRLDVVPIYEGDEQGAIKRIAVEAVGRRQPLH